MGQRNFGGTWTEKKLSALEKYLNAYLNVFKNQSYLKPVYIDAFAGTGKIPQKTAGEEASGKLFDDSDLYPDDQMAHEYTNGSVKIALELPREGRFAEYYFIEKDSSKYEELCELKKEYPDHAIRCHNGDANNFLQNLCAPNNVPYWNDRRAVVFLDPFGMNLDFATLDAISKTCSVDVWILFPLGQGVARLLQKDGNIPLERQNRLTKLFGTEDWRERFYQKIKNQGLFANLEDPIQRDAKFEKIGDFFLERLRTLFPWVLEKPLMLYNSKNNPIYLLCFAAGNHGQGGKLALKIASSIIEGMNDGT